MDNTEASEALNVSSILAEGIYKVISVNWIIEKNTLKRYCNVLACFFAIQRIE